MQSCGSFCHKEFALCTDRAVSAEVAWKALLCDFIQESPTVFLYPDWWYMGWNTDCKVGGKLAGVSWSPGWWSAAQIQLAAGYWEYPSGNKHPPMFPINDLADEKNSSANFKISAQLKAVRSLPLALPAGWALASHPEWGVSWRYPLDKCDLPLSTALSLAPFPGLETLPGVDSISSPCWSHPYDCQRTYFPNFSACVWGLQTSPHDHCVSSFWLTCLQRAASPWTLIQTKGITSKLKMVATTYTNTHLPWEREPKE